MFSLLLDAYSSSEAIEPRDGETGEGSRETFSQPFPPGTRDLHFAAEKNHGIAKDII